MIWFTADLHLGHNNIIKYCNRPFNSVKEMNGTIIKNWNAVVDNNKDTVYVLGDFSMSSDKKNLEDWFNALKGKKILVVGNHDSKECLNLPWKGVFDVKQIKYQKQKLWLSHYAHRTWPNSYHGSLHLYGHSHGALPNFKRSMDVGVDAQNFKPISIDQVLDKLSER